MLDKGAKYVVVHGLPPSGCFPLHLTFCPLTDRDQNGCSKSANSVIMAHNELLQKKLEEIRNTYKDCMIIYVDYYRAYQTILTNLQKYQFQEPFKACCGSGKGPFHFDLHSLCGSIGTSTCKDSSQHISWDGLHLTETMHQHLADLFFNQSYCKPSFAELVKKKKGY
ncbi:SGNH/GDSL hydrolase family protein [Lactovum miscens]|jgi:phospholipase/lecithinase/hemolysin